jgi:hypothetical protein
MSITHNHHVYYAGRMFYSLSEASIELNVSLKTIYLALDSGFLRGKPITDQEPDIVEPVVIKKQHHAGEPLIPHPVVDMISSNWRG